MPDPPGGRPTIRPTFDPEAFARESESRIAEAATPSSELPTVPPAAEPASRIASASDVPMLTVAPEDLEWFDLPALSRSLLGLIDGRTDVLALAVRRGVTPEEVLAALEPLARDGLITWRD